MTSTTKAQSTKTTGKAAAAPVARNRDPITFERAVVTCPSVEQAETIATHFGHVEPVAYEHIRETTKTSLIQQADALNDNLNEKALDMHMQRIVAGYVNSAFGAGQFYGDKKRQAQDVSSALYNDYRDEDRDGVAGFESKAERARNFAATAALQAFALLATAEGAVQAYEHVIGSSWKPYVASQPATQRVDHQAAQAQLAALGD